MFCTVPCHSFSKIGNNMGTLGKFSFYKCLWKKLSWGITNFDQFMFKVRYINVKLCFHYVLRAQYHDRQFTLSIIICVTNFQFSRVIRRLEGLFYLCSENKGADLRISCALAADQTQVYSKPRRQKTWLRGF